MAQPWQTIKGGGSATPDPIRQARATKTRNEPRAARLLGWTRTAAEKRWARRIENVSLLAVAFMALSGILALLPIGGNLEAVYGIAVTVERLAQGRSVCVPEYSAAGARQGGYGERQQAQQS